MEGSTIAYSDVVHGSFEVVGHGGIYYSSQVLILFVSRVQVSCAVHGGENLLVSCCCAGDRWTRRRA
jgi:hypothetical protein